MNGAGEQGGRVVVGFLQGIHSGLHRVAQGLGIGQAPVLGIELVPFIRAWLLPCESIVRRSSKLSADSKPACSSHGAKPEGLSNSALISQRRAPSRTTPTSARAPSASCSASINIDLPAPVSPVRTVNPSDKFRSSSWTMTKSRSEMLLRLMSYS